MAEFLESQKYLLKNEGGWSDIDSGTYKGIARKFWPDWGGWAFIDKYLPLKQGQFIEDWQIDAQVNTFYKHNFFNKIQGDLIESQAIAAYLYDWYVNAGGSAIKCLQQILGVTVDGGFGSDTLHALNSAGDILQALHSKRLEYYTSIAVGKNARYLVGWLNRANGMYDTLSA